jgi:hypothetical protein
VLQSRKQEGARQNKRMPHNVLVPARNDPKQEGARQNQLMPQNVLVPAQNAPGNSDNRVVIKLDERLLHSKPGTNVPLVHVSYDTYYYGAPNEGYCKYFIKKIWKYGCIPAVSVFVFNPIPRKDLFELCYKLPMIKQSMHFFRLALDARDASDALHKCIASKNLKSSDLAGLTRCWEDVYDDLGKSAWLIVFEGNPSYINEIITRPQFFNLLGGNPRTNSAELTPWISNLTHEEICALMDENLNGTIKLGEVDAAKHKNFLVVVGPQDQRYVEELRRILTDNPDTHYSQCIAWLETLPQSDPQMPETTFLERLGSNVATFVWGIAPALVMCYFTGPAGAGTLARVGHVVAHASVSQTPPWTPHINKAAEPAQLPVFAGDGNRLGK